LVAPVHQFQKEAVKQYNSNTALTANTPIQPDDSPKLSRLNQHLFEIAPCSKGLPESFFFTSGIYLSSSSGPVGTCRACLFACGRCPQPSLSWPDSGGAVHFVWLHFPVGPGWSGQCVCLLAPNASVANYLPTAWLGCCLFAYTAATTNYLPTKLQTTQGGNGSKSQVF